MLLVAGMSSGAHASGGPAMMGLVLLIAAVWILLVLPFSIGLIALQFIAPVRWRWIFRLSVPAWFVACTPVFWLGPFLLPIPLLFGIYALAVWQGVAWTRRHRQARLTAQPA
ncbi:hypothetical protein [Chitinimonas naiadis]